MRTIRPFATLMAVALAALFVAGVSLDHKSGLRGLRARFERESAAERAEREAERAKWKTARAPMPHEAREGREAKGQDKDKPGFDEPEQFARILYDMRVPADRTRPEYPAGYLHKEFNKAYAQKSANKTFLPWRSVGPGNVAGRARAIVVDPDDATHNTWFIASVGGGVWKTTDAGATWTALTDAFPVLAVQSLAMAASNHNVLYTGTGESFYNVDTINGDGILKSTDRGVTWTHLAATTNNPAFNNVARIVIDPTNPNVVLAATTVGRYKDAILTRSSIYKSTDGGSTWTEVWFTTDTGTTGRVKKCQQIVPDPTSFSTLYATVERAGILKSIDAGNTWTFVNTGISDFTGRFELAISPLDHLKLFASAEGASGSELWISTNGGSTWSRTTNSSGGSTWLGSQGWYDNTIVCSPTNQNVVYVGGIYLWQITLSGTARTAARLSTGAVHVDNHGLVVVPGGAAGWHLLNTNDGGVGLSASGASTWTAPIDGMISTQFYGVDKRPGGVHAYFGGMQDNGTWFSPSDPVAASPWVFAIGGDGYEASWNFDDPQKMIGAYQYNGILRSLDGGQTWVESYTNGLTDYDAGNAPFITKIGKTNQSPDFICAVGKSGVWRSTDFGGNWVLSSIPAGTWGPISSFHDVKISRANPGIVWAGSRMDATAQIQVSSDAAVTFNPVANYTTVTMGGISGLSTHPTDQNTAYVLFSFAARPKILKTTNLGATWTDITGFAGGGGTSTNGFPDVAVYDLLVFSNDPNHLWAGTEIGIVESLDGGATWALADNGLPRVSIWDMNEVEDEVILGTHGRGVWAVTMPELLAGKTYRPLIDSAAQVPSGALRVELTLRTVSDSTQVFVDGVRYAKLPANTAMQSASVDVPIVSGGTKTVMARAWRSGSSLDSVTRTVDVYAPRATVVEYANTFETPTDDFTGSLFTIGTSAGFSGSAIHSPHPYADNSGPVYQLKVSIRVALQGSTVAFDEVAIVEPGEPGSVFGTPEFYDYVVVEGTRDGATWLPIAPGWDCRDYADWLNAWNLGANGTSAMFHRRTLNLTPTFSPGETILLRWRLYADAGAHGWGWVIDNLNIQQGSATAVGDLPPARVALAQNAPNPFNPSTTIRYDLPREGAVSLDIYDIRGRLVRTLVESNQPAGAHAAVWDGRNNSGANVASGEYIYRLKAGGEVMQKRMMLVR